MNVTLVPAMRLLNVIKMMMSVATHNTTHKRVEGNERDVLRMRCDARSIQT